MVMGHVEPWMVRGVGIATVLNPTELAVESVNDCFNQSCALGAWWSLSRM